MREPALDEWPNLRDKRYILKPESSLWMRCVRDQVLPELQERYPEVQGITFFGSRTVGLERADSDLDLMVWYDFEKRIKSAEEEALVHGSDREFLLSLHQSSKKIDIGLDTMNSLKKRKIIPPNPPLVFDVSTERLRLLIEEFSYHFDLAQERGILFNEYTPWFDRNRFEIAGRFCLGVGQGLYRARAAFLDALSQYQKGEALFAATMDMLSILERARSGVTRKKLTTYPSYPKTITEARKRFCGAE